MDLVGTVLFAAVTAAASAWSGDATSVANLVVSAALFLGGSAAFTAGFLRAAGRSRTEVVDLAGLFYLTGSGPVPVRRWLLGLWFAQIAIAVAGIARISPPFGVMAPVWGIGLLTLWAARHGRFPPRTEP